MKVNYTRFNTALGQLLVVGDKQGISNVFIDNNTIPLTIDTAWQRDDECFADAKTQLRQYAEGKRTTFSLTLNPAGTDFQQRCWQALQQIPYGETRSYSDIANTIGHPKAARAVGLANHRNPIPIIIPCHRVIGAKGQLTGYAYGLALKQQLLNLERQSSV